MPVLALTPSPGSFGPVLAGKTTPAQTFTLTNSGTGATGRLTITLSGPGFKKTADRCRTISLGPGRSCVLKLTYTGTNRAEQDAGALTAQGAKTGGSATLPLAGTTAPAADLAITKRDSPGSAGGTAGTFDPGTNNTSGGSVLVGGMIVYTVTVSNNGPGDATGATVTDTMPAGIASDTWAVTGSTGGASAGNSSGAGNISDTVSLPAYSDVTFTVTATVSSSATGTLVNTATVTPPVGAVDDPNVANNSSTDTVALDADLAIKKTDSPGSPGGTAGTFDPSTNNTSGGSVLAGGMIVYTITVSNNGPGDVTGATVSDAMPAEIASDTWAVTGSTGGASVVIGLHHGTGNIDSTLNMPDQSSVTFTVNATVSSSAAGPPLGNTATVTPPAGVGDPNTANNSSTDVVALDADLVVRKTDSPGSPAGTAGSFEPSTNNTSGGSVPVGGMIVYTIVVSNLGPGNVSGATVTDTMPAGIASDTWSVTNSTGGVTVGSGFSGEGSIDSTLNMPDQSSVTFTVDATVSSSATGTLVNTATITPPTGVGDPNTANNSSTDTVAITP
jgi:uncharacterized repeat protein (TIGR01451 family)